MKTVKELCLGVAVAGVVAGAGSAAGGAVAFADTAEPAGSDTAATAPAEREPRAHAAPRNGSRGADRSPGGSAQPEATANEAPRRAAARLGTADAGGNDSPAVQSAAAAVSATPPASAVSVADRVDVAAVTEVATAAVSAPVAVAAPAKATAATAARVLVEAAALLAAPVSPLVPAIPLPLPTPALPVAPASSVTVSASSTTSRSRSANASASQIGDPPVHVLLIGTDGTNMSKILADPANVGFFDMMDQSVTGTTTLVGHTTISNPSWSTILTGVWDSKTGVINNLFDPRPYTSWPTVFNQLEYFNSAIDTAVVADWDVINAISGAGSYPVNPADNHFISFTNNWADTDQAVVDKTIDLINNTSTASSSFLFSYQVQVDEAGHTYGGGSAEYKQAVTNVSDNIAEIMAAVAARETATGEDWTVIVTTDHGHQQSVGFGHGFQSPNETSSFIIADFAGDSANDGNQNLGYSNVDITPTIVKLFGAPLRSDFDGVPIQTNSAVGNGIVTPVNLNQALNDALGMYGYPNIGIDIALGTRTVFASIPYFLNGFVTSITGSLQSIVDADIFLVSTLAQVAEFAVQIVGDILVGTTQALARVVATLTGSGVIAPTDPPLPPPPVAALLPTAVLA